MSNYTFSPVQSSPVAVRTLALTHDSIEQARADDAIFLCVGCGSLMYATTDANHSREQQQAALAENFMVECCDPEDFFLI